MDNTMDFEQKWLLAPTVAYRCIAGEAVLVDVKSNRMLMLNETGAEIWNLLGQQRTMGEIVESVSSQFDVVFEQAQQDAVGFIDTLQKRDLIVRIED